MTAPLSGSEVMYWKIRWVLVKILFTVERKKKKKKGKFYKYFFIFIFKKKKK